MSKLSNRTRAICEAAVMVALALVLDQLRLYRLPNGGSITIAIMPLVFFAIRYGAGWGFLAGFEKYQKKVSQAIKRARHLALMPYVGDLLK